MSRLLILALVLACPLMMLWMMRGHRRGGHGGDGDTRDASMQERSTTELRRRRDELDRLIEQRETEEATSLQDGERRVPPRSGRSGHDRSPG